MKDLILFACIVVAGFNAKAYMVYGDSARLGNGKAKVFADIDHRGNVRAVGFALSEKALEGLPEHNMLELTLKLPSILQIPPYNHMVINWEPHGHPPENVYNVPHFDFHFYFISEETRKSITCQGADAQVCTKQPDATELAEFYVPGDAVPQMGWHWADSRSPEFHGKPFTATFINGYYNGHMHFVEPMVTLDYLRKKENFNKEVSTPAVWPTAGYFPKAYSVYYDAKSKYHFITLNKLTKVMKL